MRKVTDKGLIAVAGIVALTTMVCTGHSEAALWSLVLLGIFFF